MRRIEWFLHAIYWFLIYSYAYYLIAYMSLMERFIEFLVLDDDYMPAYMISVCIYMIATGVSFVTSRYIHNFFKNYQMKSFKVIKGRYKRKKMRKNSIKNRNLKRKQYEL